MKAKVVICGLVIGLAIFCFTGCGEDNTQQSNTTQNSSDDGTPQYTDWIAGENKLGDVTIDLSGFSLPTSEEWSSTQKTLQSIRQTSCYFVDKIQDYVVYNLQHDIGDKEENTKFSKQLDQVVNSLEKLEKSIPNTSAEQGDENFLKRNHFAVFYDEDTNKEKLCAKGLSFQNDEKYSMGVKYAADGVAIYQFPFSSANVVEKAIEKYNQESSGGYLYKKAENVYSSSENDDFDFEHKPTYYIWQNGMITIIAPIQDSQSGPPSGISANGLQFDTSLNEPCFISTDKWNSIFHF